MAVPAPCPAAVFPAGFRLGQRRLSVAGYRKIYNDIGGPWLWWLRRVMPDELLAQHLSKPTVCTYLLTLQDKTAGFF